MVPEEVLRRIASLGRVGDVLDLMSARASRLGYSVLAIGAPPRGGDFNGYFHSTWPQAWVDLYIREGLIEDDPMAAAAAVNAMPFLWSDLLADRAGLVLRPAQRRAWVLAAEHGYLEGVCVPIHGPGAYLVLASYGGRAPDTSLAAVSELHLLTLHAHVRLSALTMPLARGTAPLHAAGMSAREIEALACVFAGLTDDGMAHKMGIGARTARFHVDNARRKLGARTRAQAVAAALAMGLFSP